MVPLTPSDTSAVRDDAVRRPIELSWPAEHDRDAARRLLVTLLGRVHPDDRASVEHVLRDALASPGPFASAHRGIPDGDEQRAVVWVGTTVAHDHGVQLVGEELDVTAEHERAMQEYVREAIEASNAHRASIEHAKGILMAEHHLTQDEAFEMLRRRSNESNVKLRELAELVVTEHSARQLGAGANMRSSALDGRPSEL